MEIKKIKPKNVNSEQTVDILNKIEASNTQKRQDSHAREVHITAKEFVFQESEKLGQAIKLSTGKIQVKIDKLNQLTITSVGRLTTIAVSKTEWIIGRIESIETVEKENKEIIYYAFIGIIGSLVIDPEKNQANFSRGVTHVANIGSQCYTLEGDKLAFFMSGISKEKGPGSLILGKYIVHEEVPAFVDGNKLFQRHMALLGSTGNGKSWTVATLVEQLASLEGSNVIIFDIHGEYKELTFARQLRIASPGDTNLNDENVIFMPAWFFSYEELMAIFLDETDHDSTTQAMVLNNIISDRKRKYARLNGHTEILKSLTIDSPLPFTISNVLADIKYINKELVSGIDQGEIVRGPYFGKFDRFVPRLEALRADRRYGFFFEEHEKVLAYDYINSIVKTLMGTGVVNGKNNGIKIIDFSLTPSDMIPLIIGAIGRFMFQVQFWNTKANRHPVILICDEAHLYLPPNDQCNKAQRNAIFHFGRIAKEGRKYGITLGIVSQRPSDVNSGILSQCGNIMTMGLTNTIDQEVVKKLMPEGMVGLIEELPLLGIGEIIVIGDSVKLPLKIKVSPPYCQPSSATLDFCAEWAKIHNNKFLDTGVENMRKQNRG